MRSPQPEAPELILDNRENGCVLELGHRNGCETLLHTIPVLQPGLGRNPHCAVPVAIELVNDVVLPDLSRHRLKWSNELASTHLRTEKFVTANPQPGRVRVGIHRDRSLSLLNGRAELPRSRVEA